MNGVEKDFSLRVRALEGGGNIPPDKEALVREGAQGLSQGGAIHVGGEQHGHVAGVQQGPRREYLPGRHGQAAPVGGVDHPDAFFRGLFVEGPLYVAGNGLPVRGERAHGDAVAEKVNGLAPAFRHAFGDALVIDDVVMTRGRVGQQEHAVTGERAEARTLVEEDFLPFPRGQARIEGGQFPAPGGIQVVAPEAPLQQDILFVRGGAADAFHRPGDARQQQPRAACRDFMQQGLIHDAFHSALIPRAWEDAGGGRGRKEQPRSFPARNL